MEKISEIFALAAELACKDGVAPIKGIWERRLNDKWTIVINGSDRTENINIPMFHMYVEFNGFPAGLLSPYDGVVAAGEEANEDTLICALKEALKD